MERWRGQITDELTEQTVANSRQQFHGRVWDIVTDDVEFSIGTEPRDFMVHTGAVATVALDESNRVYLIRQYRHPVSQFLFELPAGLLDIRGEDPADTAARELAEEAGLTAATWHLITDFFPSPGGSSECIRLFLARDIQEMTGGRIHTGEAEEESLPGIWVPLPEAVELVLCGKIGNAIAVIGILATAALASQGFTELRDARQPWPARDELIRLGRVRRSP